MGRWRPTCPPGSLAPRCVEGTGESAPRRFGTGRRLRDTVSSAGDARRPSATGVRNNHRPPGTHTGASSSRQGADRSTEQLRRVVVVQPVDHLLAAPLAYHQADATPRAAELVGLASGTAPKAQLLLCALHDAGALQRYVPSTLLEIVVRDVAEQLVEELWDCACTGSSTARLSLDPPMRCASWSAWRLIGDDDVVEAALVAGVGAGGADAVCAAVVFDGVGRTGERRGAAGGHGVVGGRPSPLERSNACERFGESVLPGPAGREVKRPASGAAREPAGEREQPSPERAGGADGVAGQAEDRGPAQQVVGQAGDDRPGGVGEELPGREVRERLVFELADGELDDGCWRCSDSTTASASVRLVTKG